MTQAPPPSGPPKASSPYSRFIPREELSSFQAWTPGSLTGGGAAPAPSGLRRASDQEHAKPDTAAQIAAQLRASRQSGYQDGYRDGLVALENFKQSFAAQMTAQIGALVQTIGTQLDSLEQEMARSLAISATQMARQIVRGEVSVRPELVQAVAREAVDALLLSARHITLRVHPDDLPLVAEGAADVLQARGARLVADAQIARGGCLVESDIGVVDATMPARWSRCAAGLGNDEAWGSDEAPGSDGAPSRSPSAARPSASVPASAPPSAPAESALRPTAGDAFS